MGRHPSMEAKRPDLRKGAWTQEEDMLLRKCIEKYGAGKWRHVPQRAGLNRCRKSCRLRWLNYLSPSIKRGSFAEDEDDLIIRLHKLLGNRWSLIAGRLPGRTANDVKNYWNTHLSKKLEASNKKECVGSDSKVAEPQTQVSTNLMCSRDGLSTEAKHLQSASEVSILKSHYGWAENIISRFSTEGENAVSPFRIAGLGESTANFGTEENSHMINRELFPEQIAGWEDLLLMDVNFWSDLDLWSGGWN